MPPHPHTHPHPAVALKPSRTLPPPILQLIYNTKEVNGVKTWGNKQGATRCLKVKKKTQKTLSMPIEGFLREAMRRLPQSPNPRSLVPDFPPRTPSEALRGLRASRQYLPLPAIPELGRRAQPPGRIAHCGTVRCPLA